MSAGGQRGWPHHSPFAFASLLCGYPQNVLMGICERHVSSTTTLISCEERDQIFHSCQLHKCSWKGEEHLKTDAISFFSVISFQCDTGHLPQKIHVAHDEKCKKDYYIEKFASLCDQVPF
jgi:hypothetical protein